MASITLQGPLPFKTGTVNVYTRGGYTGRSVPGGSSVTSASVAADGSLTFTGLTEDTPYIAYQGSPDRYLLFTAAPPKVSLREAVSQQSAQGVTAGFAAGSGTAAKSDSTFTGGSGASAYTVGDVVAALKKIGLIAP